MHDFTPDQATWQIAVTDLADTWIGPPQHFSGMVKHVSQLDGGKFSEIGEVHSGRCLLSAAKYDASRA